MQRRQRRPQKRTSTRQPFRLRDGSSPFEDLFALVEFFTVACLSYELINRLNYWFSHLSNFTFVFRPAWVVLFMPPCMACLAVVLLVYDRVKEYVFRRFLRRSVPDSWQSPALSGSLRKIAVAWAALFGALSFAIVPIHTRISESGVAVYPIWPLLMKSNSIALRS